MEWINYLFDKSKQSDIFYHNDYNNPNGRYQTEKR